MLAPFGGIPGSLLALHQQAEAVWNRPSQFARVALTTGSQTVGSGNRAKPS